MVWYTTIYCPTNIPNMIKIEDAVAALRDVLESDRETITNEIANSIVDQYKLNLDSMQLPCILRGKHVNATDESERIGELKRAIEAAFAEPKVLSEEQQSLVENLAASLEEECTEEAAIKAMKRRIENAFHSPSSYTSSERKLIDSMTKSLISAHEGGCLDDNVADLKTRVTAINAKLSVVPHTPPLGWIQQAIYGLVEKIRKLVF